MLESEVSKNTSAESESSGDAASGDAASNSESSKAIEKQIWAEIAKVIDPEIGLAITDLGLIYKVEPKEEKTVITMTFTSMACPYGPQLRDQVHVAAKKIVAEKEAEVHVVFNPPWDPYTMASDEAKMVLGMV